MIGTGEAEEWSALYARLVLRAAQQSAKTRDLQLLLLERVAGGAATADAVRGALVTAASTSGRRYTDRVSELTARFVTGLIDVAAGGTAGAPADDDAAARRAAAQVQAFGRVYFDLLTGLVDAGAAFEDTYLRAAFAAGRRPGVPALHLAAPAGGPATSVLTVENTTATRDRIRLERAAVRRADGIGPAFVPDIVFEPHLLSLGPGAARDVRVSVMLDRDLFEPGAPYIGYVHLVRAEAGRMEVPLHILAAAAGGRLAP